MKGSRGRGIEGSRGRLWVLLALIAVNSAMAEQPSAKDILEKAAKHYEAVKDYVVDAKLTLESPSVHVPEMLVRIYFKKPNKVHIESRDGFALLPKQGIVMGNPLRDLMAGAELSPVESGRAMGHDCHIIRATIKQEGRMAQSTVWIDKKDYLVRQIHMNPDWGPTVKVKLWYTKAAGKYWLPNMTTAQVTLPPIRGAEPPDERKAEQPTVVTIKFSNYRVNTGLSDKIFEDKERGN